MLAVTVAAIVTASALGGSATAKLAACPDKALCVWENDNYGGQLVVIQGKGISNKLARDMDDAASSAENTRGRVSFLYPKKNGKGESYCLEPETAYSSLGSGFNDVASSSKNTKRNHCPL